MSRKKNYFKLAIVILSLLIIGGVFFLTNSQNIPQVAVVTYDGGSFSPAKVTIAKDGKIILKNESDQDFWPASDFHPDNGVYPDFNSQKPLSKGDIFEFKFSEVGEWGYHNHLYPFHRGIVIVTESKISLLKLTKENCGQFENYRSRELCWYKQMKKEIKKKGIKGALKLLVKLYAKEPLFGQGCHDITHLIGDEAYRLFKSGKKIDLGKESTYCGYGFYHGFIEAMLYTSTDYSDARSFCDSLGEGSHALLACYHGIGHSTFGIHDPTVWGSEAKMANPALELCEKVTLDLSEEKTKQCASGVFNALAIAYSNDQYNLKMNELDPVWFCRSFKPLYKKPCFIEVASTWIHKVSETEGFEFTDAAVYIASLNDKIGEEAAMAATTSEYTRLRIGDFDTDEMVNNCHKVKNTLVDWCMLGVVEGLFLWGKPEEEYKLALTFCGSELLTKEERVNCYDKVIADLSGFYSPDKKKTICEHEIPEGFRESCNT